MKYRTKNGSKNVIKNHFWFNKEPFWFSLLEPFSRVLKKFLIEPSEMVQGNLKSQEGS